MKSFGLINFVMGVSDKEVIKTLKDYDQHLEESNPALDIFRWLCFTIMKWLVDFVNWMSNITHDVLTLFGLIKSTEIIKMLKDLEPVIVALFAGTLLYLGIKMMLGSRIKTHDKFITLIVAIIFLTTLSSTTDKAVDLTEKATEDVDNYTSEDSKSKIGTDILKNSVIDLKYMDKEKKWAKPENNNKDGAYNKLTNKSVNYIDINEKIGRGKADTDLGKEVTKKKLSTDPDGKEKVVKLDDGFYGLGGSEYYRYSLRFFKGSLGLICTALGYFFAGFAIASIIFETLIGLFVAVFGASTLQGDKLKSTIVDMLNGLVAIVFVFICMFIFKQAVGFLLNKNMGLYTVGMIAGAKFMIDGPKMIERKFGYDSGLSAPIRTAMSAYTATKLATKGTKAGVGAVGTGAKKFSSALKSDVNSVKNAFSSNSSENNSSTNSRSESTANNNSSNELNQKDNNQNTQVNRDDKNLGEQSKETADNQSYADNSHTNTLESEKANSESNNNASGGKEHDQLWANKPEGNVFGRANTQNNTQSFNSQNGKEASINSKIGNDVVNQGANSSYSSNQISANDTSINSQGGGYNTPKEVANSPSTPISQTAGYNAPKNSTNNTSVNNQNTPRSSNANNVSRYNNTNSTNGFNHKATSQPHQSINHTVNKGNNIPKSHQSVRNNVGYSPKTQPVKVAKEVKTHNLSNNRPKNTQRPIRNSNQTKNRIKPKR